jgi:hypothetical protein
MLFPFFLFFNFMFPQEYSYTLTDINPASPTYSMEIGPAHFSGKVTLHYFGHQY